LIEVK
jgi:protein-arginine kinase activator protein McsA